MTCRVLIFSLCFLLSCGSKSGTPKGILSEKKMRDVLWDVMRADQFLTDFVFSKDTTLDKRKETIRLYRRIFSSHKISEENFRQSFAWYRDHPQRLKKVLDSIANKGTAPPQPAKPDTFQQRKPPALLQGDTTLRRKDAKPVSIE